MTGPTLQTAAGAVSQNSSTLKPNSACGSSSHTTFPGRDDGHTLLEAIFLTEHQLFQQQMQQQLQQMLDKHYVVASALFEQSSACLRQQLQHELQNKQLKARQMQSIGEVALSAEKNMCSDLVGNTGSIEAMPDPALTPAAASAEAAAKAEATKEMMERRSSSQESLGMVPVQSKPSSVNSMLTAVTREEKVSATQSAIRHALQSSVGTGIIGGCIVSNTLVMFVQLQWLGSLADASLGMVETNAWRSAEFAFNIIEYVFATVFAVEFLLNFYAWRWSYFRQAFNVVDTAIVTVTTLDVFVFSLFAVEIGNISVLRVFRLAKLARALRIVRTMTFFTSLRVLMLAIFHSFGSLFWSLVVMFLMMLLCAIFLCQTLHEFVLNESADLEARVWVNNMFGSGDKSLYTVFEMTFSGCWPSYTNRLVKDVNPAYAPFFGMYISFVVFGLVRIISALFLKETLQQAARDADIMVRERAKKTKRLKQDLNALFDKADTSGDGRLDMEELEGVLAHPKVRLWLGELGVDASDAQLLFELIDDGDGEIQRDEFVDGMTRLKGEARAQDLLPVQANCCRILGHTKAIRNCCEHIAETMDMLRIKPLARQHLTLPPLLGK